MSLLLPDSWNETLTRAGLVVDAAWYLVRIYMLEDTFQESYGLLVLTLLWLNRKQQCSCFVVHLG